MRTEKQQRPDQRCELDTTRESRNTSASAAAEEAAVQHRQRDLRQRVGRQRALHSLDQFISLLIEEIEEALGLEVDQDDKVIALTGGALTGKRLTMLESLGRAP
jgi:hypothetical protein